MRSRECSGQFALAGTGRSGAESAREVWDRLEVYFKADSMRAVAAWADSLASRSAPPSNDMWLLPPVLLGRWRHFDVFFGGLSARDARRAMLIAGMQAQQGAPPADLAN